MNYSLRPATPEDREFLYRLYCTTREEIAALGWKAEQQEAFLRMQFNAQQSWYGMTFPEVDHRIIQTGAEPIGRMMTARGPHANLLVDISLLPEYRGTGIGTDLIKELIASSRAEGRRVQLQVLKSNRAQILYQRLGFIKTYEDQIYVHMETAASGD